MLYSEKRISGAVTGISFGCLLYTLLLLYALGITSFFQYLFKKDLEP
jgi:hypothetical protein